MSKLPNLQADDKQYDRAKQPLSKALESLANNGAAVIKCAAGSPACLSVTS